MWLAPRLSFSIETRMYVHSTGFPPRYGTGLLQLEVCGLAERRGIIDLMNLKSVLTEAYL